jgi:hypothetical protein
MTDTTKKAMTEDLCHLIYVQLQFDWRGETDLPADFMQRLDARGWIAEGENNGEFYITDEGEEAIDAHLSAQREGEIVVTKDDAGQIVAVTRQDEERRILSVVAENAPRAITLSEALNTLSDFAANGGTLHGDYAYELHAAVDKMAQREGEAVAFTSIDDLERLHDDGGGIGRVEVNSRATAHRNVPLYISPPHPRVEVTDEMVDRAMTAYEEFLCNGDEADYEAMRAAIQAAINGNAFFDSNIEERMHEDAKNACHHCGESGHKDDAKPRAEPYAYIYEYDTYAGVHREFSPLTWNGLKAVRTVPVYTAQPSPLVDVTDEMIHFLQKWSADGCLQTFEDRQRFRKECAALEAVLSEKGHV